MWTEAGERVMMIVLCGGGEGVSFGGGYPPQSGRGIVCMCPDIIFEHNLTVLLERWLHD